MGCGWGCTVLSYYFQTKEENWVWTKLKKSLVNSSDDKFLNIYKYPSMYSMQFLYNIHIPWHIQLFVELDFQNIHFNTQRWPNNSFLYFSWLLCCSWAHASLWRWLLDPMKSCEELGIREFIWLTWCKTLASTWKSDLEGSQNGR